MKLSNNITFMFLWIIMNYRNLVMYERTESQTYFDNMKEERDAAAR